MPYRLRIIQAFLHASCLQHQVYVARRFGAQRVAGLTNTQGTWLVAQPLDSIESPLQNEAVTICSLAKYPYVPSPSFLRSIKVDSMRQALGSVSDSRSPAMGPIGTAENDEEEESDKNTDATANGDGGGGAAAANGKRKQQPRQAREEVFALSNTEDNESLQGLVRSRGSLWIGKFGLPSPPTGEDESEVREEAAHRRCMGQVNGTERARFPVWTFGLGTSCCQALLWVHDRMSRRKDAFYLLQARALPPLTSVERNPFPFPLRMPGV